MSRVTLEVPPWARDLASWEVCVGEDRSAPGDAIEVEPRTVHVNIYAFLRWPSVYAAARVDMELEVPDDAEITIRPPLDALQAVAIAVLDPLFAAG